MDLYSLLGFALVAAVAGFTVKQFEARIGALITLSASAVMLLGVIGVSSGIIGDIRAIGELGGVAGTAFKQVVKAVGTAYLAEFAKGVCRDLGEYSLMNAVELTGRVLLLIIALPAIRAAAESLIKLVSYAV